MKKDTFALRPPMGWNSYDYYDTTVDEKAVRANADYMAKHLKDHGWEYVVIDIQWYAHNPGTQRERFQYIPFSKLEMDDYGRLLPDPDRFPSSVGGAGFKPLADYIHSLGLKFGIHIMRGIPRMAAHLHLPVLGTTTTANEIAEANSICPWNPDMYGVDYRQYGAQEYYDSILALYAEWGVDFIKCDDICVTSAGRRGFFPRSEEIRMLSTAIEHCGREIVLSLSPGGALLSESWTYARWANMWRITGDFWDAWPQLFTMFERCEQWQDHVKPGRWPDCDMLPLGKVGRGFGQERDTGFNRDEQKTMLTLWAIFRSPLMLGAELTMLDDETLSYITNDDILRMNIFGQDAHQVARSASFAVWTSRDSETGEVYAALFNLSDEESTVSVSLSELEADASSAKELWTGKTCAVSDTLCAVLPPHGAAAFRLAK
ncbi:MAG: glycoside hydrolase family 27 protein [Oscillospiraceae bacterium]|nr:glycoside hydrolase family 27 protein [Oscillospiraceae bacterium]MBQ3880540.1 glycoside hydrolase family 27 protein [Oscillospiraceae bacterium]